MDEKLYNVITTTNYVDGGEGENAFLFTRKQLHQKIDKELDDDRGISSFTFIIVPPERLKP